VYNIDIPQPGAKESMTEETEKSALGHVPKKKRKAPEKIWKTARSLKPGKWLMDALVEAPNSEMFTVVRDSYRFTEPAFTVTHEEWETYMRNQQNFGDIDGAGYAEDEPAFDEPAEWQKSNDAQLRRLKIN
jgi:hypothetical protein